MMVTIKREVLAADFILSGQAILAQQPNSSASTSPSPSPAPQEAPKYQLHVADHMPGTQHTLETHPTVLEDYQMQLMLLELQNKKRFMMARREQDSLSNLDSGNDFASSSALAGTLEDSKRVNDSRSPSLRRAACEQRNKAKSRKEERYAAWKQAKQRTSETQMLSRQEQDAIPDSSSSGFEGIWVCSDSLDDDQSSTPLQSFPEQEGAIKRWTEEDYDKELKVIEQQSKDRLRLARQEREESKAFGIGTEFLPAVQQMEDGPIFRTRT